MSPLEAIRAVYRSGLSSRDKAVAAAWCSHLGGGVASAGPALLARETSLSKSSCKRALAELRKMGVLDRTGQDRLTETGAYQIDRFVPEALPSADERRKATKATPERIQPTPVSERPRAALTPCHSDPVSERHDPPGHSGTTPRGTAAPYGGQAGGQAGGQIPPTVPQGTLGLTPPPEQPKDPPTPKAAAWASKAAKRTPHTAAEVQEHVQAIVDAIMGKPPRGGRYATAAKPVLALWKACEYPPIEEFRRDLELIAKAARECPDGLFAHDIRGEGWSDGSGTDRSRSVATICVQERFADRLRVAEEWKGHAPPTTPDGKRVRMMDHPDDVAAGKHYTQYRKVPEDEWRAIKIRRIEEGLDPDPREKRKRR